MRYVNIITDIMKYILGCKKSDFRLDYRCHPTNQSLFIYFFIQISFGILNYCHYFRIVYLCFYEISLLEDLIISYKWIYL